MSEVIAALGEPDNPWVLSQIGRGGRSHLLIFRLGRDRHPILFWQGGDSYVLSIQVGPDRRVLGAHIVMGLVG